MSGQEPTVFLSYSHKDRPWADRLKAHLQTSRSRGLLDVWDDASIEPGSDWRGGLDKALSRARVVVLILSPDFLASDWLMNVEVPLIADRLDRIKVIAAIARPCDWPAALEATRADVFPSRKGSLEQLRSRERESALERIARRVDEILAGPAATAATAAVVDLSALPLLPREFVGREGDLKTLDEAWESGRTRTLWIVGPGGTGKSALVGEWLARMARDGYRGAELVLGWSFHDERTAEGMAPSAFEFAAAARRWLSLEDPRADAIGALGRTLERKRTLLILDGVDAQVQGGAVVADQALYELLGELGSRGRGLIVATSRVPPADIGRTGAAVLRLRPLTRSDAVRVLRSYRIQGPDSELEALGQELGGNALALHLAGDVIARSLGGDARERHRQAPLLESAGLGGAIDRLLTSYERSLDAVELATLRMLSLFENAASNRDLAVLHEPPAIAGLTDATEGSKSLDSATVDAALGRLAEHGLTESSDGRHSVHPVVRTAIRRGLREAKPRAFEEAHARLFRHFGALAPSRAETLDDARSIATAIAHGCAAQLHADALAMYRDRMARGDERHVATRLGAPEVDLAALEGFFETRWDRPVPALDEGSAAEMLLAAGWDLYALGRLQEAKAAVTASLNRGTRDVMRSERATILLGNVHLSHGEIAQALAMADRATSLGGIGKQSSELFALRARAHFHLGDYEASAWAEGKAELKARVHSRGENAIRSSDQTPPHEFAGILVSEGRRALEEGDFQDAEEKLDLAIRMLRDASFVPLLSEALIQRAQVCVANAQFDAARTYASEALELCVRHELRLAEIFAHVVLAATCLALGEIEAARSACARAEALAGQIGERASAPRIAEIKASLAAAERDRTVDPYALAFRLVVAGQAPPEFLAQPEFERLAQSAKRVAPPGTETRLLLAKAHELLEAQQPGVQPDPLWLAWIRTTQPLLAERVREQASA